MVKMFCSEIYTGWFLSLTGFSSKSQFLKVHAVHSKNLKPQRLKSVIV